MENDLLVDIRDLHMYFPVTKGILRRKVNDVKAVDGVSFFIRKGETLGLVGESGCGKTTVGKCIIHLYRPTSGQVLFEGKDLVRIDANELRQTRQQMQMIFQDPFSSLDPRMSCGDIIGEPIKIHHLAKGEEYRQQVKNLLLAVGLDPDMADRFPHEFSGGQRQRISIARALTLRPSLIVCDEPVSALDVSIQAQIINLLLELRSMFNPTNLFIAHDLSVVQHVSDRIAVMYLGKIVEITSSRELYTNPLHPYTISLMSAIPVPDPDVESTRKRIILTGDVPSSLNIPAGCNFHTRCPKSADLLAECTREVPVLRKIDNTQDEHWVACHGI